MIQFDEHIFQMGWFNHQLVVVVVVVVVVWKNHYQSDGEDSSNFMNPSDGFLRIGTGRFRKKPSSLMYSPLISGLNHVPPFP